MVDRYMSKRGRFAQMLGGGPNLNNGTVGGGLAEMLKSGLQGYMLGADQRDQRLADEAMAGADPKSRLTALEGMKGNEYAGRLASQLRADQEAIAARQKALDAQLVPVWSPEANAMTYQTRGNIQPGMIASAPQQSKMRTVTLADGVYAIDEYGNKGEKIGDAPAKSGQTIKINNEPSIPKDHIAIRDGQGNLVGYEVIPGSPTDIERQSASDKATENQEAKALQASVVNDDITRALDILNGDPNAVAGLFGPALTLVPGSPAKNFEELVITIRGNVGFDKLQSMRELSPTGGALGSVSEQENRTLQSVLGSLAQSQSPDQLRYNLKRLHNVYNDIVHGPGNGPQRYNLNGDAPAPQPVAAPQPQPQPAPAPAPQPQQMPQGNALDPQFLPPELGGKPPTTQQAPKTNTTPSGVKWRVVGS